MRTRRFHVFLHRALGVGDRILRVMQRFCIDDLLRSMPLGVHRAARTAAVAASEAYARAPVTDSLTKYSLEYAFSKSKTDSK